MQKIAIICGGPSLERGISLNSARSVFDNLDKQKYQVTLLYVNPKLKFFKISPSEIYSNTPLDFDFRLYKSTKALNKKHLRQLLKNIDIAFPLIHGAFGEDGKLQSILENFGVKYTGSGPKACQNTANKHLCQKILKKKDFVTIPYYLAKKGSPAPNLPEGKYVAKPLHGGSSIGVQHIQNIKELNKKLKEVFKIEKRAIIEPHCEGKEFTVIVLQNAKNEPVALLPTEIEIIGSNFFDYRKKYLATGDSKYHTPARFSTDIIKSIQKQAERAFICLEMKDFARLDGWVLNDSNIWFSDINAISGMEQNSFLFQQTTLLGFSHGQLLNYIITKKNDQNIRNTKAPIDRSEAEVKNNVTVRPQQKEKIPVIFGGSNAEKQVSIMSGTNVWMKLKSSLKYEPVPFFLSSKEKIYHIPAFLCLQHTVEEIEEKIKLLQNHIFLDNLNKKQRQILKKLDIAPHNLEEPLFQPLESSFEDIAKKYKFLFLGLHGGKGENGTYQNLLDKLGVAYNGPGAQASNLCMDKFKTSEKLQNANISGVTTPKKMLLKLSDNSTKIWEKLKKNNFQKPFILKPRGDGCSAGIIKITNLKQFKKAINYFKSDKKYIPAGAVHSKHQQIVLPNQKLKEILIEEFIKTDKINLKNLKINWKNLTGWIEITVGLLGNGKNIQVLLPSQTIASREILSLEEKFMGGTGINLVPPPKTFVKTEIIKKAQQRLKKVAKTLGIDGYSRVDCFMNIKNGNIIVIEANTLPALTPSTTFFQQAIKMKKPLTPLQLLEKIIELGKKRKIQFS